MDERLRLTDGTADLVLPEHERGKLVSAHVPVVLGCSHACTFCIIPSRRGAERSRPAEDILAEVPLAGGPGREGDHPARSDR